MMALGDGFGRWLSSFSAFERYLHGGLLLGGHESLYLLMHSFSRGLF